MDNITKLREQLIKDREALANGTINVETAKELARNADIIVKSCKTQLEYNKYIKNQSKINFLEGN